MDKPTIDEPKSESVFQRLNRRARALKRETYALYLAIRDPRTPWFSKVLAICVVSYAFSPLDLIPDFVPVLGMVDDVILLPLGIWLTLRTIPPEVMADCRARAAQGIVAPKSYVAALVVIVIWLALALLAVAILARLVRGA